VKRLLETIARTLVDHPDDVHVEEYTEEGVVHLDMDMDPGDRGMVIGRKGRTVAALRTLVDAVAKHRGTPADLEILD
jgi:predicted RNA-binding protein YlqC (UPF0109 family)